MLSLSRTYLIRKHSSALGLLLADAIPISCQVQSFSSASSSLKNPQKQIRLTKRMSELDICSRREAEKYILQGRVLLQGQPVDRVHGLKVDPTEQDIVLLSSANNKQQRHQQQRAHEFSWDALQTAAVVLHKPVGYVSGQPGQTPQLQDHIPAVRLLTPQNAHIQRVHYQDNEEYQQAKRIVQHKLHFRLFHPQAEAATLQHYVPAGRLDLESSGLLLFTNRGVVAKKLVSAGLLQKEYWVVLEPLHSLSKTERALGMTMADLPKGPTRNLKAFRRGGYTLFGDTQPLRPVVEAEWLTWHEADNNSILDKQVALQGNARRKLLRIVLKEGRKHQIRRMCRELLGLQVVQLVRTKIGPLELTPSWPAGKWRPLRRHELEAILGA